MSSDRHLLFGKDLGLRYLELSTFKYCLLRTGPRTSKPLQLHIPREQYSNPQRLALQPSTAYNNLATYISQNGSTARLEWQHPRAIVEHKRQLLPRRQHEYWHTVQQV